MNTDGSCDNKLRWETDEKQLFDKVLLAAFSSEWREMNAQKRKNQMAAAGGSGTADWLLENVQSASYKMFEFTGQAVLLFWRKITQVATATIDLRDQYVAPVAALHHSSTGLDEVRKSRGRRAHSASPTRRESNFMRLTNNEYLLIAMIEDEAKLCEQKIEKMRVAWASYPVIYDTINNSLVLPAPIEVSAALDACAVANQASLS